MSDWKNNKDTYKQCPPTPYCYKPNPAHCYRPNSARRVNSVRELNRLLERIAELEKALGVSDDKDT